jgi:CTP:molybdopterin cytidylyltransferase MocA
LLVNERVVAVIFEGGQGTSAIDQAMAGIRKEVTLDTCEKILSVAEVDEIVLCTNYPDLAARAADMGITVDYRGRDPDFHFGLRLREIVESRRLENVMCMGGVAAPLIQPQEIAWVANTLKEQKNVVVLNNVQSADLVAFTPASVLFETELPANDNHLGTALRNAGLRRILIPNSGRINFDLDTPTDVMVLALQPGLGRRSRAILSGLDWPVHRLQAACEVLRRPSSEVLITGRVGPSVVLYLNMNFTHRVRVVSEERGMKALGRDERGEVVSLLGFLLEEAGPQRFVELIENVCHVAFMDTRVIFHHLKKRLSDHDRFNSDLGRWELVTDPDLRDFTRVAMESKIPIILGGHSLVSGGLWILAENIVTERERRAP